MATPGSPFRHTRENWVPRDTAATSYIHHSTLHESNYKADRAAFEHSRALYERDVNERLSRSRSPIAYRSEIGRQLAMDEARYNMVATRYAVPERIPTRTYVEQRTPWHQEVTVIKKVSGHQDYFVSELQAEVNELRYRQGDILQLREQISHL